MTNEITRLRTELAVCQACEKRLVNTIRDIHSALATNPITGHESAWTVAKVALERWQNEEPGQALRLELQRARSSGLEEAATLLEKEAACAEDAIASHLRYLARGIRDLMIRE